MAIATNAHEAVQEPTGQVMLDSHKGNNNSNHAPRDLFGYRSNTQFSRPTDMRTTQRKPTPSPLQMSAMMADSHHINGKGNADVDAPLLPSRTERDFQYTSRSLPSPPRSPHAQIPVHQVPPISQEHLVEASVEKSLVVDRALEQPSNSNGSIGEALTPPESQSYCQHLSVSPPFPQPNETRNSSPHSHLLTTTRSPTKTAIRPVSRSMPRTSSIDSAVSDISNTTSHSHKSSQDSYLSNQGDLSVMISLAGSPETLILRLLNEKEYISAQNNKLWKLVDKQRSLLFGLNEDLERALIDKDRYRKKLKEHIDQATSFPNTSVQSTSRSPTPGYYEPPAQSMRAQEQGMSDSRNTRALLAVAEDGTNATAEEAATLASSERKERNHPTENAISGTDSIPPKTSSQVLKDVPLSAAGSDRTLPLPETGFDPSIQKAQTSTPVVTPSSFTAKRSQTHWQKAGTGTPPALISSSPQVGSNDLTLALPRKLPPAPLDLRPAEREEMRMRQPLDESKDHSGSEYDETLEVKEIIPHFDRGRKKTREEDDEEREAVALKEQQERSRSKKEKSSKARSGSKKTKVVDNQPLPQSVAPMPSAIRAVSPPNSALGASNYLSAPTSLASVLTPTHPHHSTKLKNTLLSAQPLSPGLPMSPRPIDRPMNSPMPRMARDGTVSSVTSPPLSPRSGLVGLPLSPRATKQNFPLPPQTPISVSAPTTRHAEPAKEPPDTSRVHDFKFPQPAGAPRSDYHSELKTLVENETDSAKPKGLYKGFISDAYPDLLIAPNALPSIIVKVISSRLRPSRNSYVANKGEEDLVFTLGVSARSDSQELWQVEKSLPSLLQLDQQLKQFTTISAKLPDRGLFNGHAPSKIDARREALERYFEIVLDTPMDERAALALCHFLSTQIVEPVNEDGQDNHSTSGSPITINSDARLIKEGYLTKKGKNFGGWKARFFVLDDPVLRYYESPGGSLLGTIKLSNAKIAKPQPHSSDSPSRGEEGESEYRHAFGILEPKRKDSSSHVRHVLCAESDAERDAWVQALVCYVERDPEDEQLKQASVSSIDSGSSKKWPSQRKDRSTSDSPQSATFDGLQTVSYDDTVAASPPVVHILPDKRVTESPSPPNTSIPSSSGAQKSVVSKPISGPSNGAKIHDVGAWGNKPLAPPQALDREHKKRSIWGFHNKQSLDAITTHSNESALSLTQTQQQYYERISNVKPAFGLPLADAVECCPPRGVNVCLPAVVYRCLEFLRSQDAWSEEGIFRVSGSNVLVKGLRDRFNNEGDLDFLANDNYYDVHTIASLLKLYLRDLPATILTRELHLDFLQIMGMYLSVCIFPHLSNS